MALKIRLWQQGRKNYRSYRIVVADIRSPRDGKYVESLGWYNPLGDEKKNLFLSIDKDRLHHWLVKGAQPTEKALSLFSRSSPEVIQEWKRGKRERKLVLLKKRRESKKEKGKTVEN